MILYKFNSEILYSTKKSFIYVNDNLCSELIGIYSGDFFIITETKGHIFFVTKLMFTLVNMGYIIRDETNLFNGIDIDDIESFCEVNNNTYSIPKRVEEKHINNISLDYNNTSFFELGEVASLALFPYEIEGKIIYTYKNISITYHNNSFILFDYMFKKASIKGVLDNDNKFIVESYKGSHKDTLTILFVMLMKKIVIRDIHLLSNIEKNKLFDGNICYLNNNFLTLQDEVVLKPSISLYDYCSVFIGVIS